MKSEVVLLELQSETGTASLLQVEQTLTCTRAADLTQINASDEGA